ncbi:hypothetical protein Mal48_06070 [Thalassoglobus polymorphus]|uniref:Uncharacterized protein n=1 Tax=Thalassoglobus polymorphus TaxID=2527994 RepID=A0A517QID8_9PLAN|nr:hypothetical protein Mal48_06070 [Thalassoglobus polymorphus]
MDQSDSRRYAEVVAVDFSRLVDQISEATSDTTDTA